MALWQRDYMTGRPYETPAMKSQRLDRDLDRWIQRKAAQGRRIVRVVRSKKTSASRDARMETGSRVQTVVVPLWFRLTMIVLVGLIVIEAVVFVVRKEYVRTSP